MSETTVPTGEPELVALVRQLNEDLADRSAAFDSKLWAAMTDAELHLIGIPEEAGGAGGMLSDLVATVFECARAGAAIPLAENWLAQSLRATAGLGARPGVSICARPAEVEGARASPTASALAFDGLTWAPHADELLVLEGDAPSSARPTTSWTTDAAGTRYDLAGQPAGNVSVEREHLGEPVPLAHDELLTLTDLLRTAQLGGAIRGCFDLSRGYAAERHQFGVRIDSFPAVQHHLIQLAQAAAITRVSAFRVVGAIERGGQAAQAARAARVVANESARVAIRCAHQLHGAIGMTREYPLASLTRRLHWWRLVDSDDVPQSEPGQRTFLKQVWLDTNGVAHS
ncbi:acyl-CoA dehydrogenase family protein [Pseudonocardia lutea]|uniref:Acyl-CoA dehydrogenase family protein n=1 Tax=Pseudonocardia lutea TaxID=2172015 RepID=A0ABW1I4B1_9PSEU